MDVKQTEARAPSQMFGEVIRASILHLSSTIIAA